MSNPFFEHPILNSPYACPQQHWDPYNPTGSTAFVRFNTSKTDRWETSSNHCHINWVILDSDWEAEFCRVAEAHPRVRAYVKNHNLGFEVPYRYGSENRKYRPDFIVLIDDGHPPRPDGTTAHRTRSACRRTACWARK